MSPVWRRALAAVLQHVIVPVAIGAAALAALGRWHPYGAGLVEASLLVGPAGAVPCCWLLGRWLSRCWPRSHLGRPVAASERSASGGDGRRDLPAGDGGEEVRR